MPRAVIICALLVGFGALGVDARAPQAGLKLRMREGRPLVDGVFVNDHGPYRFLLDTGASVNHFDLKKARGIGLRPTFETKVTSATGSTTMFGAAGISVSLEGIKSDDQTFLFGGIDTVRDWSSDIQGVLGQSFLSKFDYLIDVKDSRLVLGDADSTGTRVPLRIVTGRPAVDTSLGTMILDSGAHCLVLFNVMTTFSTQSIVTMSGAMDVGTAPAEVRIKDRVFWRGEAIGLPSSEQGIAGLLPLSYFKRVYISNSHHYVVVE